MEDTKDSLGTLRVPRVMLHLFYEVKVLSWQKATGHVAWVAWLGRPNPWSLPTKSCKAG